MGSFVEQEELFHKSSRPTQFLASFLQPGFPARASLGQVFGLRGPIESQSRLPFD
jgi:hypothetical protein